MASHLVRARSAYKDIWINSFNHTHIIIIIIIIIVIDFSWRPIS